MSAADLDALRDEARRQWGRSTPFRLGLLAGKRGLTIANPYPRGSRGRAGFAKGRRFGREVARG